MEETCWINIKLLKWASDTIELVKSLKNEVLKRNDFYRFILSYSLVDAVKISFYFDFHKLFLKNKLSSKIVFINFL